MINGENETEIKSLQQEIEYLRQLVYDQDRIIRVSSMPSHNLLHDKMLTHYQKAQRSSFRMLLWKIIPPLRVARKIITRNT